MVLKFRAGGLLRPTLLAAASGLLLLLSFPRFELSFLAWVALAPLLIALAGKMGARRAAWAGWVTGIIFTFFAENWIAHSMTRYGGLLTAVAYGVALLFAAILALFPALFALIMDRLIRAFGAMALAFAPVVWAGTEYLRPFLTGITWNALGISQADHYAVARLSQLSGVYLVSAVVAGGSAVVSILVAGRERRARAAAALLILGMLIASLIATARGRNETRPAGLALTVAGVQPNIPVTSAEGPEQFEARLEENIRLTREAIGAAPERRVDLVVWAESPLAIFYENDPALRARLDALARELQSHLIINTITRSGERYYNSVTTIAPHSGVATLRRYDKIRLVPFGEYVPWRSVLGRFVPAIVGDFTPGSEAVTNRLRIESRREGIGGGAEAGGPEYLIERTTGFVSSGAFICYEAAYPDLVRQFVRRGATLLINVSDDAWFGDTAGAEQHLAHARMRAIENDRDLFRVTNTGITALVTSEGDVLDPLPSFAEAFGVWRAEARSQLTPYTRYGDWFGPACLILSALAFAFRAGKEKSS